MKQNAIVTAPLATRTKKGTKAIHLNYCANNSKTAAIIASIKHTMNPFLALSFVDTKCDEPLEIDSAKELAI